MGHSPSEALVQFQRSPPILSRVRLAAMPPGLGPGFRGFESHMRDQFIDSSAWDASWFAKPVYCESGNSSILFLSSKLSLCNVNLVDGLIWSQEAVRSNRTMETNLM